MSSDSSDYSEYDEAADEEEYLRNLAIIGGVRDDASNDSHDEPSDDSYDEYVEILDETKWSTCDQYFEEQIVIAPEDRVTSNILAEFEYVSIIATRAHQIAHNANCMVDRGLLTDPKQMAIKELLMRKCPLSTKRQVGVVRNSNGSITKVVEYWSPNEMILPSNIKLGSAI